jgi:regulator of replication initiation timing
MRKILALSLPILAIGFMTGCEDKAVEEQQNQKIENAISEVTRMREEVEELKLDNTQLKQRLELVTGYIRKKVEEDRAKTVKPVPTTKTGAKTAPSSPTKKKTTEKKF